MAVDEAVSFTKSCGWAVGFLLYPTIFSIFFLTIMLSSSAKPMKCECIVNAEQIVLQTFVLGLLNYT